MYKKGQTANAILEILSLQDISCCKATVYNVISLWKKLGDIRPRYPKQKRKPKCQPDVVKSIDLSTKNDRFLKAADLVKSIERKYGKAPICS